MGEVASSIMIVEDDLKAANDRQFFLFAIGENHAELANERFRFSANSYCQELSQ